MSVKLTSTQNYDSCVEDVQPILELFRGKLFLNLIKIFTYECTNNFGTQIFSIKKSYSRTLTNLLSSWMFSLYIDYDFSGDYFFPKNYNNTSTLEYILKDLCKYNNSITDIDTKIENVIINLKKNYKYSLLELDNYKKSLLYKNNKNNYKIQNTLVNIKKHSGNDILFSKLEISIYFKIKDRKLLNIVNNILIPNKIYEKLAKQYIGPKNKLNDYLWSIIFRYQLLGSNNHQLAVLPNIMMEMNKDFNLNFECFASAINSTFSNYCSIYYDLERYFGSVGNFFNITPKEGTFGFNPPYQKDIINLGINRLFYFLENAEKELTFIITIPIWDLDGKEYMKKVYNNELEKQNIDYGDFEIISQIKESKFFKILLMIPKEKFTYVDHNFELYKNKTIQNTYVIILSNTEHNIEKLKEYSFI